MTQETPGVFPEILRGAKENLLMTQKGRYRVRTDEIQRLLERSALTLDDLAQRAKADRKTIRHFMNGGASFLHTISRVANALGTRCDALLHPDDRLDLNDLENVEPRKFRYRLALQGSFLSEGQHQYIRQLTNQIIKGLAEEGIEISGRGETLSARFAALSMPRIAVGISASANGHPWWILALIRLPAFKRLLQGNELSLEEFNFGELVGYGPGDTVPRDAIIQTAQLLECNEEDICILSPLS